MRSLFIVCTLLGSKLLFAYSTQNMHLNSFEYNRYVRPQLISITGDYYTLLSIMNPELKALSSLYVNYQKLKKTYRRLELACKAQRRVECSKLSLKIRDLLISKSSVLNTRFNLKEKDHFNPNNLVSSFDHSLTFRGHYFKLKDLVERFHFLMIFGMFDKNLLYKLKKEIIVSENYFNIYLIELSDNRFRVEFNSFWSEFIKPVNNFILFDDNVKVFKEKLGDLNLRLHFLNVVLTKRNKDVNKQALTLLKVIHRRWNNILKVTLRR